MQSQAWQQIIPLVLSVIILVVISILRAYSNTLAAITASMPVTIPLAFWIVYAGSAADRASLTHFAETLLLAMIGTFLFVLIMWYGSRAGWPFLPTVLAGYGAWAAWIVVLTVAQRVWK